MFISDITDAIERDDRATLERAFRTLVGWPSAGMLEGSSPKSRRAALGRICEALATDDNPMPEDVAAAVRAAGGKLTDSTHSAGAYHVKQHRGHFHQRLEQGGSARPADGSMC